MKQVVKYLVHLNQPLAEGVKNMRIILITLFSIVSLFASITEEGAGIIYGKNHVFSLQAPKGWVLDNESGVSQGLHAVFYPIGETWRDSKIMAYARGIIKNDENIKDINSFVNFTIENFKRNGHLNYKGSFHKTLKSKVKNKIGYIYFYEGDNWNNFEAVAYFEEEKTINIIVLNSQNKKVFEKSLFIFYDLVSSYMFIGNEVKFEKTSNKLVK